MATPYQLVYPVNPFTPLPFGLASAVNWQTADERWEGGIQWESTCATGSATISPCITGAPVLNPPEKAATWDHTVRGARPYTLFSEVDCSPVGWSWENAQRDAAQGFLNAESFQLERIFQTGRIPGMGTGALVLPNLTTTGPIVDEAPLPNVLLQPASIVVSGAGVDVVEGLGILEATLGVCYQGGTGVVHLPLRLASALQAQYELVQKGPNLHTQAGNRVAIGAGYDASFGPGGVTAPAGYGWMWGTGPLFGWRSPIRPVGRTVAEVLDRADNTQQLITERTVVLGWDCCLVAVLVTLGGEPAGTFGTAA